MNEIINTSISKSAAGSFAVVLGAAIAAGNAEWPDHSQATYVVRQTGASYSTISSKAVFNLIIAEGDAFNKEIRSVYATLLEGQSPLGSEFEAVWDANLDQLYEA